MYEFKWDRVTNNSINAYGCHFFNEIKDLKTLQEEVSKLKREVFTLSKDSSKNMVEPHKLNVKNKLKKTKKTVSSVTP